MASSYSSRLRLEKQGDGENATTWGTKLNTLIDLVDTAISGVTSINVGGLGSPYTVSSANGVSDEARSSVLYIHGSCSAAVSIVVPAVEKVYVIDNATSGSQDLVLEPTGGTGVTIPAGGRMFLYTDGTTAINILSDLRNVATYTGTTLDVVSVSTSIGKINHLSVNVSASITNMSAATGSFTTKVSTAALEVSGVVSASIGEFKATVSAAAFVGNGSGITGIVVTPQNYLTGMQLSNATDTEHDISISSGTCRDSADGATHTLSSAVIKQLDASWVTGTNQGGLSSSLSIAADTWYHVHSIVVAGVTDVGFDTSPIATNLIADHTATSFRRIGSVLTDASGNIIQFTQFGDEFLWNVSSSALTTLVLNATPSVKTDVTIATPLSVTSWAMVTVDMEDLSNGGGVLVHSPDASIGIARPNSASTYPGQSWSARLNSGTNIAGSVYMSKIRTDKSSLISFSVVDSGADLGFYTLGWWDSRGKDG